jgi:hypothetical protein
MAQAQVPGPYEADEMDRFLETFLYTRAGFLVDEVTRLDREAHEIEALLDTERPLPMADLQRVDAEHPAHVAGPELVMATGSLGCMHAWFFHGCRWDEGWVGFGNRIHRAAFKSLARRGPPLHMHSRETRARTGAQRVLIRYEFHFRQEGRLVYVGDQTAMFLKGRGLGELEG